MRFTPRDALLTVLLAALLTISIGFAVFLNSPNLYAESVVSLVEISDFLQSNHGTPRPTPNPELPTLIIASNIEAQENAMVTVPIAFYAGVEDVGAVVLSIDFDQACLVFDDRDENGDGTPDAIQSTLPNTYQLFAQFSAADTDGELDLIVYDSVPPADVPLPTTDPLLTIDFWMKSGCAPVGGVQVLPITFSSDPAPSFGSLGGISIPGNLIDGSIYLFGPTPPGAGTPTPTPTPTLMGIATPIAQGPTLRIAGDQATQYGTQVRVPIAYQANGQDVSSLVFSIDYDPRCLGFWDTDDNRDGLPDRIASHLPDDFTLAVDFDSDDTDGEIDFVIFDATLPFAVLPDLSALVTIEFSIWNCVSPGNPAETELNFSTDPAASFGSPNGSSLSGNTIGGIIAFVVPTPTSPTPTLTSTRTPCPWPPRVAPLLSPTNLLTQVITITAPLEPNLRVYRNSELFLPYASDPYLVLVDLLPDQANTFNVHYDYKVYGFSPPEPCRGSITTDTQGRRLIIVQQQPETTPTPVPTPCAPTASLLRNPSFEASTDGWEFYTSGSGHFTTGAPGYDCAHAAQVQIDQRGNNIQLYQTGFPLKPNADYELRFVAKSSSGNAMDVFIQEHDDDFTNYGLRVRQVPLTTAWQEFRYHFTTKGFNRPVNDTRLRFWFSGDAQLGDLYQIDKVLLTEVGGTPPTPVPTPGGPTPVPTPMPTTPGTCTPATGILQNPSFEQGNAAWEFYTSGSGFWEPSGPGYECDTAAQVTVAENGNNAQLYQFGFALQANSRYRLRFAAKSSSGNDMGIFIQEHDDDYTNYGLAVNRVDLGQAWQEYSYEFTTKRFSSTVQDARIRFWFARFAEEGATYWIDQVILEQVGAATAAGEEEVQHTEFLPLIRN